MRQISPSHGLIIHPVDNLVFIVNLRGFWKLSNSWDSQGEKAQEIYYLERARYPVNYADIIMHFDGEVCSGFSEHREIGRKEASCLSFLNDNGSVRILSRQHSETSYHETGSNVISNSISIFVDNKGHKVIEDPPGNYYETVHFRNVSMDCHGNIYVFDLNHNGKGSILRWRPVP